MYREMEERILTIKDDLIAETLESLRKANRKVVKLIDDYKPVLHGERLMTDRELATVLRSVQGRCVITVTTASYLISV